MKPYMLKRRDDSVGIINLSEEGHILDYIIDPVNEYLAPLHDTKSKDWLKNWWSRRAVPIAQGKIKSMLESKGLLGPEEYLVSNLGLSLTDYYWISPVNSGLAWKDVNLFVNEFHDDIDIAGISDDETDDIFHYTPNSSLQGSLEKCWSIINGKRGMIKGNHDSLSAESFNEIIATKLHELQGFENYTSYKLIAVKGKPYMYGCFSEIFTSNNLELVSAYDVEISEKRRSDTNTYEHFIYVCGKHGLSEDALRPFLDYQIMTDFILTNRDRHLSNVAVLRDADSLEFVTPAPIYDSGKSMFVGSSVPTSEHEMLRIETQSFMNKEIKLLDLVKDRSLVEVSQLPSPNYVREIYSLDEHMDSARIDNIARGYEMKIELFTRWQKGEKLDKIITNRYHHTPSDKLGDIFVSSEM